MPHLFPPSPLALGPLFPYLSAGPYTFGPFTVHVFGLLVGIAIITGMYITQRRGYQKGLDPEYTSELLTLVVIGVFVGSHLFEILFYQPHRILNDPLVLIRFWDGIASFGGLIGLVVTMVLYLRYRRQKLLPYLDALMWGGVHAWVFGRLGCAFAHDHPGRFTDSWFSVRWPLNHMDQVYNIHNHPGRHDLGLYEFLYTFIILIFFYALNRKGKRFPGFTTALLFVLYGPMRFLLDFLRTADRRYFGLTPAQYLAFFMTFLGIGLFILLPRDPLTTLSTLPSQEEESPPSRPPHREVSSGEDEKSAEE